VSFTSFTSPSIEELTPPQPDHSANIFNKPNPTLPPVGMVFESAKKEKSFLLRVRLLKWLEKVFRLCLRGSQLGTREI
jgi:hypothetical protein